MTQVNWSWYPRKRLLPEIKGPARRPRLSHKDAVKGLATAPIAPAVELEATYTPAVSVKKSLANKDHIISMIDGKPYRALRRHLSTHGMTPDEYRERYGLKADYPMVAENYSEARRAMAKKIGLGRKVGKPAPISVADTPPKRRGRKPAQTGTTN